MSQFTYPRIVTNSLVFYYDMNNPNKSWRGRPTTNLAANGKVDYYSRWAVTTNHTALPFVKRTDVYALILGNNYFGSSSDYGITNSNTYTVSYWYYIDTTQTMNHYAMPLTSSYSAAATASISTFVDTNNTRNVSGNINGWVWGYKTFTVNAAPTYMRGTFTNNGDNDPTGVMYITNVVIEAGSTPSGPYGYTGGTRSSTQAILDLVGQKTITASSLTYAVDGTFSFNGSNNYLNVGVGTGVNQFSSDFAVSAWVMRQSGGPTWGNVFGDYYTNSTANTNEWQLMMGNLSGTVYFNFYRVGSGSILNQISSGKSINEWINVTVTRIGFTYYMYVDGIQVATASDSNILGTATGNFNIGIDGNNSAEPLSGKISTVMIYKDKGLTATEVLQNYNATKAKYKGSSSNNAASSALEILAANPTAASGTYWIDLPGLGPTQCYCDMTTAGGGWIHIGTFSDNNEASNNATNHPWGAPLNPVQNTGIWEDTTTLGSQSFTADFKSAAWSRYYMNQMLIKDQGATQRNLLYTTTPLGTRQTMSYFWSQRTWAATGSDSSNSAYSAGRVYGLAITTFGTADPVLDASNKSILLFKYGEADGAQDVNKDRTMIAWHRHNAADGVDAPVGIGCFTNRSGSIDYRDIVPSANSADWPQSSITGAPLNYTLWVR